MKFTIVTSVLNGAEYLSQTIDSVLAQSHIDFEYIILDAGSTDASPEIAAKAAAHDARVRLVEARGTGLYEALFTGLDLGEGEILAWINADDLYTPWAFSCVDRFFESAPGAQWVTGLPSCWDAEGRMRYVRPSAWAPRQLIRAGWFHQNLLGFLQQESMFFKRSLFGKLSGEDRKAIVKMRLAGDFALWKRFAAHAHLEAMPTVLGGFRRHDANMSYANMDDYMAEAKQDGATFLPWPLRPIAQRSYQIIAAQHASRRAREADVKTWD